MESLTIPDYLYISFLSKQKGGGNFAIIPATKIAISLPYYYPTSVRMNSRSGAGADVTANAGEWVIAKQ